MEFRSSGVRGSEFRGLVGGSVVILCSHIKRPARTAWVAKSRRGGIMKACVVFVPLLDSCILLTTQSFYHSFATQVLSIKVPYHLTSSGKLLISDE